MQRNPDGQGGQACDKQEAGLNPEQGAGKNKQKKKNRLRYKYSWLELKGKMATLTNWQRNNRSGLI